MVLKLDAQRLRKSGVALPPHFSDYLIQMEKKLDAKREAKKSKIGLESKFVRNRKVDGNGPKKLADENVS